MPISIIRNQIRLLVKRLSQVENFSKSLTRLHLGTVVMLCPVTCLMITSVHRFDCMLSFHCKQKCFSDFVLKISTKI